MRTPSKIVGISVFVLLTIPLFLVMAADYELLAPIPQLVKPGTTRSTDINTFIPKAIQITIAVASGLAVIRIITGGIQYMSTDSASSKGSAKDAIQGAVLGLLLAGGAWIILNTVNPRLVKFDLSLKGVSVGGGINTNLGGNGTALSAEEAGCKNNCVPIDPLDIPIKVPGGCSNEVCFVTAGLASKLKALATELSKNNIQWQVTEAFPPTVNHIDPCHGPNNNQSGSCVDAALFLPTIPNIRAFLTAIEKTVGTNYEYERCDSNRNNPLVNEPTLQAFKTKLKCEGTTTAQHAHINFP